MVRLLREPVLAAAAATSLALALTVAVFPGALWLAPLALLGGIWAPGYAIVRLVQPFGRLSGIERHALSAGAGLLLLPVLVVALSLLHAFAAATTALALTALTLSCALVSSRGGPPSAPEPSARSALPGTRTTLTLAAVSVVVAAFVLVPTLMRADAAPAALALTARDGGPVPLTTGADEALVVHVVAYAGGAPRAGQVVVTWEGAVVAERDVRLPAGGVATLEVRLPAAGAGAHELRASWEGHDREVHALIQGLRA